MFDYLIIGCGLTGSVIARRLAERGYRVEIWDRRTHTGGNLHDRVDEYGIRVQDYGPHAFHTKSKEAYDFIRLYEDWVPYRLTCGAAWDGKCTPTPFNFSTVDAYYPPEKAAVLKEKLGKAFGGRTTAAVTEALSSGDPDVRAYARFLFENDYSLYTAKQWGISPAEIDPSVLKRVPLRFSYGEGYFDDEYQVMPAHGFSRFFENLLNHENISVKLGTDARGRLRAEDGALLLDGEPLDRPAVYTGALDELFGCRFGRLPYRTLRFEWRHSPESSLQKYPIVAYPKAEGYTRITEFRKLPVQAADGTTYALEYPVPYTGDGTQEPYYPVLTAESQRQYGRYRQLADAVPGLIPCGRLADFRYYNMDQAILNALECAGRIPGRG